MNTSQNLQPIVGQTTKRLPPGSSQNIAPNYPSPAPTTPGTIVYSPEISVFITLEEALVAASENQTGWDLTPIINEINDAVKDGCFNVNRSETVLITVPSTDLVEKLAEAVGKNPI